MLTAYPTRSFRHSKGHFGKWMLLGAPLLAVAAGLVFGAGHPGNIRTMSALLPDASRIADAALNRPAAPVYRSATFRISGPASVGIAVLTNDSPELRARAERARITHASEQLADDVGFAP